MRTKTKLLSLFLAFAVLFVSIFGFGIAVTARADGGGDAGISDSDSNQYTSLYYFSDFTESGNWFTTGFLHNFIQNSDIKHSEYYYWSDGDFWQQLYNKYYGDDIDISDAFVIVEARYGFSMEFIIPNGNDNTSPEVQTVSIYDILNELFYELHEAKNCKIMFICGTDEARFETRNEDGEWRNRFLQYVDIHINTDLFTVYLYSAVMAMEAKVQGNWDGTTIVLDTSIGDSWFIYKRMVYYLFLANLDSGFISSFSDEDVLKKLGITFFFYKQMTYFDPFMPSFEDSDTYFEQKWSSASNGFVVAGIQNPNNYWLWNLEGYRSGETELYQFYAGMQIVDIELEHIFYTFIFEDTAALSQYDNWRGLCSVTYKPIITSAENDWIQMPVGETGLDERRCVSWLSLILDFTNPNGIPISEEAMNALIKFLTSEAPYYAQP